MIILDCEGDGVMQNALLPDLQQPYMAELGAIKLDRKTGKVLGTYHTMVKPPRDFTEQFTKITSITNADVANAPSFAGILPAFTDFVLGERELVAHNLTYDAGVIEVELRRIGMARRFPWPPVHLCTMEATQHLTGKALSLTALYERMVGPVPEVQTHRAMRDTEWLLAIVKVMIKKGLL